MLRLTTAVLNLMRLSADHISSVR